MTHEAVNPTQNTTNLFHPSFVGKRSENSNNGLPEAVLAILAKMNVDPNSLKPTVLKHISVLVENKNSEEIKDSHIALTEANPDVKAPLTAPQNGFGPAPAA